MSKVFSLHGKGLKLDTRADIEPHLAALSAMDDVEEVHLGGNTFGVEACQALADVLQTKKTLQVADFADIFTGRLITEIPLSLTSLCTSLIHHPTLREINLSDNAFGGRSAEPMVALLSQNTSIQTLLLNNNGLGPAGGEIVARALLASAQLSKDAGRKSSLHTVVCGRNRLEASAIVWAEAFAAHGTLKSVTMQNDGIRMHAAIALIKGLAQCPDLELLDIQDNTLTEVLDDGRCDINGARTLARVLPGWKNLQFLNLSDCVLKPRGGVLLAKALARGSNPLLHTLKLENSELDESVFPILAEAIATHLPKLSLLDLNANKADPDGEAVTKVKEALGKWGHEDAVGELDEMEEYEGEDEEEYVEEFPEEEAEEAEPEAAPVEEPKAEEAEEVAAALAAVSIAAAASTVPGSEVAPMEVIAPPAPVIAQTKPETTTEVPAVADEPMAPAVEEPVVSLPAAPSAPAAVTEPAPTTESPVPATTAAPAALAEPVAPAAPLAEAAAPAVVTAAAPATPSQSTSAPPTSFKGANGSSGKGKEKNVKKRRSFLGDKLAGLLGKMHLGGGGDKSGSQ